jgi:hypothetical protein
VRIIKGMPLRVAVELVASRAGISKRAAKRHQLGTGEEGAGPGSATLGGVCSGKDASPPPGYAVRTPPRGVTPATAGLHPVAAPLVQAAPCPLASCSRG